MGDKPYRDEDLAVKNGDFINDDHWVAVGPWSIAGGKAILNQIIFNSAFLVQSPFPIVEGNIYTFHFTLSECNFITPGQGIRLDVGGVVVPPVYDNNGTHEHTVIGASDASRLAFWHFPYTIGDFCKLDDVSVDVLGNNLIVDLGIDVAPGAKIEFDTAVNSDYQQLIATWYDNSSCRIAFNYPP